MLLSELLRRVAEGEVVPVGTIQGKFPDEYIGKNPSPFNGLTVENDLEKADVFWIYDKNVRAKHEYNPSVNSRD